MTAFFSISSIVFFIIQTSTQTMATTKTVWRRQSPSISMSRLRSTLSASPRGITSSPQSVNTLFLSRFSALDSAPHFRSFLQSGCGSGNNPWKNLVYIPTAGYCLDKRSSRPIGEQRRRARYDAKQKAALLSQAFGTAECSLLELDAANISEEVVATMLASADVVYVDGGNTFYLQRHMIESKFWSALESSQFASRGGLYVGASAGAIVAGKVRLTRSSSGAFQRHRSIHPPSPFTPLPSTHTFYSTNRASKQRTGRVGTIRLWLVMISSGQRTLYKVGDSATTAPSCTTSTHNTPNWFSRGPVSWTIPYEWWQMTWPWCTWRSEAKKRTLFIATIDEAKAMRNVSL